MLVLKLNRQPEWIDTGIGVRLHCRPMTSAVMLAVKSDLAKVEIEAGDTDMMHAELVKAIARRTVFEWEGVGDDAGEPVGVTPEGIDAVMDLHRIFEAFDEKVVIPYLLVQSEKNGSSPSPDGTSEGAGNTARTASGSARSARAN